jgi:hypothetical protein
MTDAMLAYLFPGQSPDIALVIAGVHGTEKSGVEVVRWLQVKLRRHEDAGRRPRFTTVLVPEVFPESVEHNNREVVWTPNGRRYEIPPNRQFPPPGHPLSFLIKHDGPADVKGNPIRFEAKGRLISKKDHNGSVPLLNGTRGLLQLIEGLSPKRIASVHGHRDVGKPARGVDDAPGIFVDPRYEYDHDLCAKDPVDGQPYEWGTSLCKFNLAVDAASPTVGRIVKLNDALRRHAIPDEQVRQTKADLDEACKLYTDALRKFRATHDPNSVNKGCRDQAYNKFMEVADQLGIQFSPANVSACSAIGQSEDEPLVLAIARKLPTRLVPGSHLDEHDSSGHVLPPVLHYTESAGLPTRTATRSATGHPSPSEPPPAIPAGQALR